MTSTSTTAAPLPMPAAAIGLRRTAVIGLIAFLTLVDLFAAQAILPALVQAYGVTPAAMGVAVNASTIGMAIAGIAVAFLGRNVDRRRGIGLSLAFLALPTALLASAPDLATFTALRVAQGVFMSTAFTLTMAHLAERCSAAQASGALAAYVTGNVASNLFGRLIAAAAADTLGVGATFYLFALLNLAGAFVVAVALSRTTPVSRSGAPARSPLAAWMAHLRQPALAASFAIGFLILFAFIGIFTYVNLVLTDEPIALEPMALGAVYFVFLPALVTTPLAGHAVRRLGTRPVFLGSLVLAGAGLPLVLAASLAPVLVGLALIGAGTFLAQAVATGFVSRTATSDRGAASGLYLTSYYLGGLVGSAVLGQVFGKFGWGACVAVIGAALALAAYLATRLTGREG